MPRRVFSLQPIPPDATVAIDGAEAHHLLHVLRVKPGEGLTVFDGRGGEFAGEVLATSRKTVELQVGPRLPVERESPMEIVLAAPWPKGDRGRWLVEKAVEAGVARLVPLVTERSEGPGKGSDKLGRYVVEASKQCGRNRLMELAAPQPWVDWLAEGGGDLRWLAHPGGEPLGAFVEVRQQPATTASLAVGPEGGFTDDEVAAARDAGWRVVDLGPRILRIETAAIALVTAAELIAGRPGALSADQH